MCAIINEKYTLYIYEYKKVYGDTKTMALLLAMYQKMRLVREKNQLVLDQTRVQSKMDRIHKQIERRQKYYTSLIAKVDQEAKQITNNFKNSIMQSSGLGTNSFNTSFMGGMSAFMQNAMWGFASNPSQYQMKTADGKGDATALDETTFKNMLTQYYSGTSDLRNAKDSSGNRLFTDEQINVFSQSMQGAQQMQSQAQMWVNNMNTQCDNNVSIWTEARKAELEELQDQEIEPLNYEETMLELEKTQIDQRLQRIQQQEQAYDQLVGNEAKNTAPTFGLS